MNLRYVAQRPVMYALLVLGSFYFSASFALAQDGKSYLTPVEDRSLTAEQYISLGVPAFDREWMSNDMAAAAKALQALAAKHPEQLPRFESAQSGAVFARIVSPDNLVIFQNTELPLDSRVPAALQYLDSSNQLVGLYLRAFLAHKIGGEELIEHMGALLRTCDVVMGLSDELLPTLSKTDPTYEARLRGLEQMRRGFANVVGGAVTTITERDSYTPATRAKLVGYCREIFPRVIPKLSRPFQAELVKRLQTLSKDPSMKDLEPGLSKLCDEVAKAVRTRAASGPAATKPVK